MFNNSKRGLHSIDIIDKKTFRDSKRGLHSIFIIEKTTFRAKNNQDMSSGVLQLLRS